MLPWGKEGYGYGEMLAMCEAVSLPGLWTVRNTRTHCTGPSGLFSTASLGGGRQLSLTQFSGGRVADTLLDAGGSSTYKPIDDEMT